MSKSAEMRRLITKNEISFREVSLMPNQLLTLWKKACESLLGVLESEKMLISSVYVKASIVDDIRMVQKNLETIRGVEKLNTLKLGNLILN